MNFVKTNLKAAKDAVASGRLEDALFYAGEVLESDPRNYIGLLLLGKAHKGLDQFDESVNAYERATKLSPDSPAAWKGLLETLSGSKKDFARYLDVMVQLIDVLKRSDSAADAGEVWRRTASLALKLQVEGPDRQRLLELQLPTSSIFSFLESRMPNPELTVTRLISLVEKEESEKINKAVSKNRFKISNTKAAELQAQKYAVRKASKLPEYYQVLINYTHTDSLRHETEVKLLQYKYETLLVSPPPEKAALRDEISEMASGLVYVKTESPLAWKLELEWADPADLRDLDYDTVVYYLINFSKQPLARVLLAFFQSEISPLSLPEDIDEQIEKSTAKQKSKKKSKQSKSEPESETSQNDSNTAAKATGPSESGDPDTAAAGNDARTKALLDEADPIEDGWSAATVLETIVEGSLADKTSILTLRILAALYLHGQEYESAATTARSGLEVVKAHGVETGNSFERTKEHLSVVLGTAYVYYQAPKNYDVALRIFEVTLQKNPGNIPSVTGKGLIFIGQGKIEEAEALLKSVNDQFPDDFLSLFELSWCRVLRQKFEQGREGLLRSLKLMPGRDTQASDYRAQIWWRIGQSYWQSQEQLHDDEPAVTAAVSSAFDSFVKSLKENASYAPAYTSLGVYYADVAHDKPRATKCFYKAFELDAGEIESAYRLAEEFADNSEWDLVEVIASRLVDSERLRLGSSTRDVSWPHKALGIVNLNHRKYAESAQHFQAALRLSPKDSNAWMGLGEAYSNSGRHQASEKALGRCLSLNPDNWLAQYQLGIVQRQLYKYDDAVASFAAVLDTHPDELGVHTALIQTHLLFAKHNLAESLFSLAIEDANRCIAAASHAVTAFGYSTQDIWRSVGSSCNIFLSVQSLIDQVTFTQLEILFSKGVEFHPTVKSALPSSSASVEALVRYSVLALELSLAAARPDKASQAMGWFNLGIAKLNASRAASGGKGLASESVQAFKRAIQSEPRNAEFWNAYGVAASSLNPKVSQHCFIRSLSLDMKNSVTWSNLASLYLSRGDLELASEAFDRTRTIDPENVQSWVGQAIVEEAKGSVDTSRKYLDYAFTISEGGNEVAKLLFGLSVFERATENQAKSTSGILALQQYLLLRPRSPLVLLLQSLLFEREAIFTPATERMKDYISILEADYERNAEDVSVLEKFAAAKVHLARVALGTEDFEAAIEHSEEAIGLISDFNVNDDDKQFKSLTLSALLTAGLSHYFADQFGESIEYFKQALAESEEDQDVVVLLAQVLWAQGGESERAVALDQLFSSVSEKGVSTKIALLLGIIGLLDDPNISEAAETELAALPLEALEKDSERSVQEVLSLLQKDMSSWQRAAFMWPGDFNIWKRLNPSIALELASKGRVSVTELSDASTTERTLESSQRAVFLAPWNDNAWASLAKVVA